MQSVTVDITKCSACGEDHKITFERMRTPVISNGVIYGFSGLCDKTGQEVVMRYNASKEVQLG